MAIQKQPFENIVAKGENAGNPQRFQLYQRQKPSLELIAFCHLQMLSTWTSLAFCCLIELTLSQISACFYVSAVQVF